MLCFIFGVAAVASVGAQNAARDLLPGQRYEGGAQVRDAGRALSFNLPHDWPGQIPIDSDALLLHSPRHEGVGVVAILEQMTPDLLVERLSEPQDFGGAVILQLSQPVEQRGMQWNASYLSGNVVGRALAVLGPDDQAVVYFFAGPRAEARTYEEALAELAASTRFESVTSL